MGLSISKAALSLSTGDISYYKDTEVSEQISNMMLLLDWVQVPAVLIAYGWNPSQIALRLTTWSFSKHNYCQPLQAAMCKRRPWLGAQAIKQKLNLNKNVKYYDLHQHEFRIHLE